MRVAGLLSPPVEGCWFTLPSGLGFRVQGAKRTRAGQATAVSSCRKPTGKEQVFRRDSPRILNRRALQFQKKLNHWLGIGAIGQCVRHEQGPRNRSLNAGLETAVGTAMKRAQDFRVYGLGLNVNAAVETAVETAVGRYRMPQLGPDLSIPRVMSGPRVTQHEKLAREADRDPHQRRPATEGPMWGHPMLVLGALCSFLEPFCGHLSPKLDKVS